MKRTVFGEAVSCFPECRPSETARQEEQMGPVKSSEKEALRAQYVRLSLYSGGVGAIALVIGILFAAVAIAAGENSTKGYILACGFFLAISFIAFFYFGTILPGDPKYDLIRRKEEPHSHDHS
jgi:hypothetical protein